jgi:predicted amidophosphoribosyltransferase
VTSREICSVCRKRKDRVHRNRQSGKPVCATCSDRARMRVNACGECGETKVIQARERCYACYKRQWRAGLTGRLRRRRRAALG